MADYYFKMDDMAVGYQGKALIHDINIGIDSKNVHTAAIPTTTTATFIFPQLIPEKLPCDQP